LPLSPRHALLLGLIHGPTELLPVSSSAHTALVPRLLRWPAAELEPELRTSFEVALHAGAALGLGWALRADLTDTLRHLDRDRLVPLALACAPPAAAGWLLEGRLEHRLGGTRSIALGLLGGGVAMALADRRGARRQCARRAAEAGPADGLALGLAQALALLPGVSRNGATLTAARARGFARADAQTLSWRAGLPVILGATLLKGRRLPRKPLPPGLAAPFALGAGASLASTLVCAPLLAPARRGRPLLPFALYRAGLATLTIKKVLHSRF
jgi:undecaprenyl-diphosphatase